MARSISIRTSLFLSVGLLIVALSGAIVAITLYTGDQVVAVASARVIDRALDRSESEFAAFFGPVEDDLAMARGWFENGAVHREDDETLLSLFRPMMEAFGQISSVHFGDDAGRAWLLLRREEDWLVRRVDPEAWGPAVRYRTFDLEGRPLRAWQVDDPPSEERYDPRTREWFRVAVAGAAEREPGVARPADVYWTEPYVFFTVKEPGVTGAVHVGTPDGRLLLAFDVLLRDVSAFTQGIEITPNGFVGLLSRDRRLVGVPRLPAFDRPEDVRAALLRRPRELGIDVFDDAIAARRALGLPDAPRPTEGAGAPFAFESGGVRYWSDVRTVPVPPDHYYLVFVNVPEADLLGPIRQLRRGVVISAGLALILAVAGLWWLSRSYSVPLSSLARNSQRIRYLDLQAGTPVRSGISEISQLASAQESMRTALDGFSRYVPTDVVRELVEVGEAARIGGERKTLTVMFSDIAGFTRIAERKSPEDLTRHLATYFEALLPILEEDGTVDKLVGDGIMAFWGAPLPDPHHARSAVEAIVACEAKLEELTTRWRSEDEPPLPTRFGLATGPALVGNVGSPHRLSYTAVGDVVNLASRLEGLNRQYGTSVLAAAPVPELAGRGFEWREVDCVRVVGRDEAVSVFELLGAAGRVAAPRRSFAKRYAKALAAHRRGAFADAIAELDALADAWRSDVSVQRLRSVCAAFLAEPPPDDWDGVTLIDRK